MILFYSIVFLNRIGKKGWLPGKKTSATEQGIWETLAFKNPLPNTVLNCSFQVQHANPQVFLGFTEDARVRQCN